jgi:hypothetical protein
MERVQVIPNLNDPQSVARWEHNMMTKERFKAIHKIVKQKRASKKYYAKQQAQLSQERIDTYNARYPQYPIITNRA